MHFLAITWRTRVFHLSDKLLKIGFDVNEKQKGTGSERDGTHIKQILMWLIEGTLQAIMFSDKIEH